MLMGIAALASGTFAPAAPAAEYPEINWSELVPKDWDPMKGLPDRKGAGALIDGDPRATELYAQLRDIWDNAPTVKKMDGRRVKMAGYIVPLEVGREGLSEFLLVPYFGACIHTPPPPANQIVFVRFDKPVRGYRTMDAVWVSGKLDLQRAQSQMGVTGYGMNAVAISKFWTSR